MLIKHVPVADPFVVTRILC